MGTSALAWNRTSPEHR